MENGGDVRQIEISPLLQVSGYVRHYTHTFYFASADYYGNIEFIYVRSKTTFIYNENTVPTVSYDCI